MRIEVQPESLREVADALWRVAGQLADARGNLAGAGQGVADGAGTPAAGASFERMRHAWVGALDRMYHSLTSYERATEMAAELYQHADASAMPSAPPPPPPKHTDPAPAWPFGPQRPPVA